MEVLSNLCGGVGYFLNRMIMRLSLIYCHTIFLLPKKSMCSSNVYVKGIEAGLLEERQMEEQDEMPFDTEEEHIRETDEEEYWDLLIEA